MIKRTFSLSFLNDDVQQVYLLTCVSPENILTTELRDRVGCETFTKKRLWFHGYLGVVIQLKSRELSICFSLSPVLTVEE